MKLENQVCTLEQAKKLKELGVEQLGYYSFAHRVVNTVPVFNGEFSEWVAEYSEDTDLIETGLAQFDGLPHCSAFTVAELGVMLHCVHTPTKSERNDYWFIYLDAYHHFKTEAEARAAWLIFRLEKGAIIIADVNQRLKAA